MNTQSPAELSEETSAEAPVFLPAFKKLQWLQKQVQYRQLCESHKVKPDPRAFVPYLASCVNNIIDQGWTPVSD